MKRPTHEETDGKYWSRPLPGSRWHIFEDGKSLCDRWNDDDATQPVIPEDEPDPKTDCKVCYRKAGFEVEE